MIDPWGTSTSTGDHHEDDWLFNKTLNAFISGRLDIPRDPRDCSLSIRPS